MKGWDLGEKMAVMCLVAQSCQGRGVWDKGRLFFKKRYLEQGVLIRRPWGEREELPLNK